MNRITISYAYNYEIDFAPEYIFTKCKKCFNLKTGRKIKININQQHLFGSNEIIAYICCYKQYGI